MWCLYNSVNRIQRVNFMVYELYFNKSFKKTPALSDLVVSGAPDIHI